MKNSTFIIGCLIVCAVAVSCNTPHAKDVVAAPAPVTGKFAYVNIDSFEAKYEVLKTKQDEFKKRQNEMDNELQRAYGEMQSDANEVQKKVQAGTLTEAEYNEAQKRLMQMQKSLESRRQSLTDELLKAKDDFNKDLKTRLDAFLDNYNKDKHFDFIFTYSNSGGSPLLYANKSLDITKDVVDGMNDAAKNDKSKAK